MLLDIYHIAHIHNLLSIIEAGGLFAKNRLKRDYTNIANNEIQHNRTYTRVPCASGGTLHDYVPFYFAPRSPMLHAVNGGKEYTGYQNNILHLVVKTDAIARESIPFAFTDGHAAMKYLSFFDTMKNQVQEILQNVAHQPPIKIQLNWYYLK
ncbi:MAG: DUF4433 domain-containing protein [Cyanobacteria bacterium SBLK]|nr:DUF4433 domain-containing protein [Cyanobacteria bacterium SBLK]